MSRSGAKSAGSSRGATAVYQRGMDEEGLWDDAELIRLWNMQLEQQKEEEEEAAPQLAGLHSASSDEDSVITSSADEESAEMSSSSSSVSVISKNVDSAADDTVAVTLNSVPLLQDGVKGLPADIQRVVSAYYRAGYEAGYFVGRSEKAAREVNHNKRRRTN
ncbi:hypothetical protein TraAM80_04918 [Trypanosoma rangeli]|uniref:Uncharacterized protein n=1 Tax=Trypanosoma rangeli TaxID=5698 RepID=A0A422NH51_TRYRA|nr:uncharacterized protein TraAM80_04918 [Trypanosoma rangeli]RNF04792.1 hypothetical protein TraAM80_04918 [Trypanosoma rangeli]|eukprot:RNF04792.1 hypothetical protein TraAM80_04918 [Trypanosoma rangeli]